MSKFSNLKLRYKIGIGVATSAAVLSMAGGAFAYFTDTGSGTGTGSVGTSATSTVNQAAAVNGDYSTGDGFLYPSTTQTVHLTVTNNGKGKQYIDNVTLDPTTPWTSNKAGCDVADLPGSFTMPSVAIHEDLAPGAASTNHDGVVTMVDTASNQNACKTATITFHYVTDAA